MPRPLYIICSESGAEDKRTNRFSIFNVIERMTITPVAVEPGKPVIVPKFQCRVMVAWMRQPEDSLEFEGQVAIIRPDGTEEVLTNPTIVFEHDKPVSRMILDMSGVPDLGQENGIVTIEARLKSIGAADWEWRQDYPIIFHNTANDAPVAD